MRVFNGFVPNIQMAARGYGFQAFHLLVISLESQILQEYNFSWCHGPWDDEKNPCQAFKEVFKLKMGLCVDLLAPA